MLSPSSIGLWFVRQPHPDNFGLICSFCTSGREFAAGFLQIPPHDGHPCLKLTLPTAKACSGLAPYSYCPCWAHLQKSPTNKPGLFQKTRLINSVFLNPLALSGSGYLCSLGNPTSDSWDFRLFAYLLNCALFLFSCLR